MIVLKKWDDKICETNNRWWDDNLLFLSPKNKREWWNLKKMHTKSSSSWLSPLSRFSRRILFSSSSWAHRSFAKARSALTVFNSRRSSLALAAIAIATCDKNHRANNASHWQKPEGKQCIPLRRQTTQH